MATVSEIQQTILTLPEDSQAQLRKWLNELYWEKWDRQIEDDSKAGRLDWVFDEIAEAEAQGTLKDL